MRVDGLPECWLGKNHALYLGAEAAGGEWLLFTDADVRLSAGCVGDTIHYDEGEDLDHLTLSPELISRGAVLKSFVAAFVLVFEITQRPRRATDHRARESVGVGSFNLLKLGSLPPGGDSPGHPPTSQRRHEARQVAEGDGVLAGSRLRDRVRHVEWHKTLAGAVKGLDKSIFPGADYRLSAISSRAAPNQVALRDRRAGRGRHVRVRAEVFWGQSLPLYTALHLFGTAVLIYAMLRSAYAALANGGIEWRGTT